MFLFSLGLYTLTVVIIWGFFIVIRVHAIKFKNFQTSIQKVLRFVFILLLALTIVGYFIVFSISSTNNTSRIKDFNGNDKTSIKKSLDDIGSNYY